MVKIRRLGLCPKILITALLFVLTCFECAAEEIFQLKIPTDNIMLGKPLESSLILVHKVTVDTVEPEVRNILLSMRKESAVIVKDHVLETHTAMEGNKELQYHTHTWDLGIYPREPGILVLPELKWMGSTNNVSHKSLRTQPKEVKVQIAKNRQDKTDIIVKGDKAKNNLWQREQLSIAYSVITTDKYITLDWEMPDIPWLNVYRVNQTKYSVVRDKVNYTEHKIGLVGFPLKQGDHIIEIPPVRYIKSGIEEFRFYPAPISIHVKKLPVYLNPTIPIGNLTGIHQIEDRLLFEPDEIYSWSLKLNAVGVKSQWLPPVLTQIQNNMDSYIELNRPKITQYDRIQNSLFTSQKVYDFTFVAHASRLYTIPELTLPYFNIHTGKIQKSIIPSRSFIVLGNAWKIVLVLILVPIASILVFKVLTIMAGYLNKKQILMLAQKKIILAENLLDIGDAIKTYCQGQNWPANISLKQWSERCRKIPGYSDKTQAAVNLLQKLNYSGEGEYSEQQLEYIKSYILPR